MALFLKVVGLLLALQLPPAVAHAQETLADFLIAGMPEQHRAEAQTLAICVLAEAGDSRVDHAGILYVLKRRAMQLSQRSGRYISTPAMARRYCRIFRDPPAHRAFLLGFKWNGAMLQVDFDPCEGRAMHWGSHADSKKGRPKNTVPVFCGPTRNLFWSGPKRSTHI